MESALRQRAPSPVEDLELPWVFRYCIDGFVIARAKRSPSWRRILSYHARASNKSAHASGVQTTGCITVS